MENVFDFLKDYVPEVILLIILSLLGGFILKIVIFRIVKLSFRKNERLDYGRFREHLSTSALIFIPIATAFFVLLFNSTGEVEYIYYLKTFQVLTIITAMVLLIKMTRVFQEFMLASYDITKPDNANERRIVTQINIIKRILVIGIFILGGSFILLSFEQGQEIGQWLIASAGVLSIILGLAAQKTISNMLAGIQIAFTQPIKIDDAVLVENEWGWIEEINLTYVVVKIWDLRRLVLPITYFIEKPFQNWTRNEAGLLGSVYLYLDYRIPAEIIRKQLKKILDEEPLWDEKGWGLQVTDATKDIIVMRALMTGKNSPETWELRCNVREKLINFISDNYPEALPQSRVILNKADSDDKEK